MNRDAWAILGLSPGSSMDMVRAQYLRLVRMNHPDRYADNPVERTRHEEVMKDVTWAYQEISQGRASSRTKVTPPPPSRPAYRPSRPVDVRDLQCRAHGRWAVIFCTVCGTPLCSRCDESLSGYCATHRRRRPG